VGRSRVSFLLVVFFLRFDIKWINNYFKSNFMIYGIISGNLYAIAICTDDFQNSCNKELTQLLSEDSKKSPIGKTIANSCRNLGVLGVVGTFYKLNL